ncbi:MFS transporter [Kitasatospora sp. NPDC101183]|uniref:MFS transporter n=1 Tax=Kitasatospora sp. NPDC101183 TaxID=3364100 RepID=UPI003805BBDC
MSSSALSPSYAAVLRTPHASRTFGAALVGRLSYGMVSLALVLAVKDAAGSYAVAGGVMAVFGLTSVFLSPARAALVDRYGPRRVLPPMAAGYAVALGALAVATARPGVPGAVLGVLAGVAGAGTPPLGPVMRAMWGELLPERGLLARAYSLDAVAEEVLFVAGPLLVGGLVKVAAPSVAVGVSAGLVLVGALALAASPVARGWSGAGRAAASEDGSSGAVVLRVRWAVAVAAGVGVALGALDLLAIAFADEQGAAQVVPWVLAALSAGSAVGGLAYGAVTWRATNRRRLAWLAIGLGAVLAATGLAPRPWLLVLGAALAGVFVAPAVTTAYLAADESAGPGARTRAGAWVNTALNAGSAAATAGAGLLIGRVPLPLCFALAAVPVLLAGAAAYVARGPQVHS